MRILLDECVPRRLKQRLPAHDVKTVPEMGWGGVKNGALLDLAQDQFDIFLTVDQNLEHQQNLKDRPLAVIVLVAPNNRLDTLSALIPDVEAALTTIQPGELVRVETPDDTSAP